MNAKCEIIHTDPEVHPRQVLNELAHVKMREGDFSSAIEILLNAHNTLGPHVELLADLGGCYYRVGEFENFKYWIAKAYSNYQSCFRKLHPTMDMMVRLKLVRSLIELGMISKSMQLLKISDQQPSLTSDREFRAYQGLHCNLMVINCLQKDTEAVAAHYTILERMKEDKRFSEFEIQVALLNADHLLVGENAAAERLKRIAVNRQFDRPLKRYVAYDHLFQILLSGNSDQRRIDLEELLDYESADHFEKLIHDIYLVHTGRTPICPISLLRGEGLNLLSMARFLHLVTKIKVPEIDKSDAARKLTMYLTQVDHLSRRVILKSFGVEETEKVAFQFDGKTLSGAEQTVVLSDLNKKFLKLLASYEVVSLDLAAQKLFDMELNLSALNRIKVMISRLNSKLRLSGGPEKSIVISDGTIICHIEILDKTA